MLQKLPAKRLTFYWDSLYAHTLILDTTKSISYLDNKLQISIQPNKHIACTSDWLLFLAWSNLCHMIFFVLHIVKLRIGVRRANLF